MELNAEAKELFSATSRTKDKSIVRSARIQAGQIRGRRIAISAKCVKEKQAELDAAKENARKTENRVPISAARSGSVAPNRE